MYNTTFECFKVFIPKWDEEKEKNVSIPVKVRRLIVTHQPSGQVFTFGITQRKGKLSFRDSRDNKSISFLSFEKELKRMMPNNYTKIVDEIRESL